MKKNIIVGVGNMLFKDEGIGIYASEYIRQNYEFDDENLEIIDGGTLGFKLMVGFRCAGPLRGPLHLRTGAGFP